MNLTFSKSDAKLPIMANLVIPYQYSGLEEEKGI